MLLVRELLVLHQILQAPSTVAVAFVAARGGSDAALRVDEVSNSYLLRRRGPSPPCRGPLVVLAEEWPIQAPLGSWAEAAGPTWS